MPLTCSHVPLTCLSHMPLSRASSRASLKWYRMPLSHASSHASLTCFPSPCHTNGRLLHLGAKVSDEPMQLEGSRKSSSNLHLGCHLPQPHWYARVSGEPTCLSREQWCPQIHEEPPCLSRDQWCPRILEEPPCLSRPLKTGARRYSTNSPCQSRHQWWPQILEEPTCQCRAPRGLEPTDTRGNSKACRSVTPTDASAVWLLV